jgi:hypothetical protein
VVPLKGGLHTYWLWREVTNRAIFWDVSKPVNYINPAGVSVKIYVLPTKLFANSLVIVQEHFVAYYNCREAVELFRFMLPPYSLVGTCNSVQNFTFH